MQHRNQAQEDPLNLRSLPLVNPQDDGWPAIHNALSVRSRRQRTVKWAGGLLASAATVVLAITLMVGQPPSSLVEPADSTASTTPPLMPEPVSSGKALQSLISLSQQLEGRLHVYRRELGDLPSGALVYQVELQDLVTQVDDEISADPNSLELWSQRVNLLLDISRLYEDSLRREYHQVASL